MLRNRDPKGLTVLYEQYAFAINGVIHRIVKDTKISEEILQQSFLKAWNKFESYDESKSSLYTWLSAIARNSAIDKVRLKGFQNLNKSESFQTNVHDVKSYESSHSNLDTGSLLSKLDEKYRLVLDMAYLQGYSQSEISELLNMPLGTVKTRLRKAIKILREELRNEKGLFLGTILVISLMMILCQ